jgi:signal peptidase II
MKRGLAAFAVAVAVTAVLDLWSKYEAFKRLGPYRGGVGAHRVTAIPGVMRFELATNKGVAWGMFADKDPRWIFVSLGVLALPLIVVFWLKQKTPSWPVTWGLAMIAGGTIGNLYDRVVFGHVRDFIYVYVINFPVFNIADSWICVGAALFAMEPLFVKKKADAAEGGEAKPETPPPAA